MREKLQLLMNAENLTGSKLAEYLGIQPSSISHILGGRNKPSLDFVQKILQRYPRINPDWLLLDSDEMYRADSSPASSVATSAELQFSESPSMAESATQAEPSAAENHSSPADYTKQAPSTPSNVMDTIAPHVAPHSRGVKRIIVMFDDHTFESYEPRR
jgi:transcriptional regulator with XRE-family HTH domain